MGSRIDDIRFLHADALGWEPPKATFDLVVTNFFLDCFRSDQLERLVSVLAQAVVPGAQWWLSDFQIPPAGPGRWRALLIHKLMYAFFRVATRLPARALTEPDPFLRAQGFTLCERRVSDWGLLRADCWKRSFG